MSGLIFAVNGKLPIHSVPVQLWGLWA